MTNLSSRNWVETAGLRLATSCFSCRLHMQVAIVMLRPQAYRSLEEPCSDACTRTPYLSAGIVLLLFPGCQLALVGLLLSCQVFDDGVSGEDIAVWSAHRVLQAAELLPVSQPPV